MTESITTRDVQRRVKEAEGKDYRGLEHPEAAEVLVSGPLGSGLPLITPVVEVRSYFIRPWISVVRHLG